jgi:hypothetical protein
MTILLIRVGADQTERGGRWNGPVDSNTNEFVYVPICEDGNIRSGFEKPFTKLNTYLQKFGIDLPEYLQGENMHLDPDFSHQTYGDVNGF